MCPDSNGHSSVKRVDAELQVLLSVVSCDEAHAYRWNSNSGAYISDLKTKAS